MYAIFNIIWSETMFGGECVINSNSIYKVYYLHVNGKYRIFQKLC